MITTLRMRMAAVRPAVHVLSRTAALAVASWLLLPAVASAQSEIETYRLTQAAFEKYQRATDNMYGYVVDHPELQQERDDEEDEGGSVREMVAALERRAPGLRKAMETSGMSLEEYFTFSLVLAGTALGVGMEAHTGRADDSALTPLQRENMAFVRNNLDSMQAFHARMQQKYPTLFGSDADEEEEDWADAED